MNFRPQSNRRWTRGFTLMELMTVMVLLSILSLMAYQSYDFLRAKAERAKCESNLRGLYAAASSYVTDQGEWPQIPVDDIEDPSFSKAWFAALSPYKIEQINWVCPTIQKVLGYPSLDGDDIRIDYIPSPFGSEPRAAYQWPNHPWFMERGDTHGSGNLLIFANGNVKTLQDVARDANTIQVD